MKDEVKLTIQKALDRSHLIREMKEFVRKYYPDADKPNPSTYWLDKGVKHYINGNDIYLWYIRGNDIVTVDADIIEDYPNTEYTKPFNEIIPLAHIISKIND